MTRKSLAQLQRYNSIFRVALIVLVAVLVLFTLLYITIPVFAVAPPVTLTINHVYAYQHCLENDDQLYIMDYYSDNISGYTINEFLLFRLMDGSDQISATSPYYFSLQPYGRHVMAIYLSASNAPAWGGSYTAELVGNPTVDWDDGDVPYQSTTAITWSSSTSISTTQSELALQVLSLAQALSIEWGFDLIETISGGNALSAYGETYFQNVIPHIKEMAPNTFAGRQIKPDFTIETGGTDYSDTLQTGVIGTPFDLTTLGAAFGIGRVPVTVAVFAIAIIPISGALAVGARSTRPLMMLLAPIVYCGVLVAGLPIMLAIAMGLIAMLLTGYVIFFQKGSA